jgi:hypothetical protein
LQWVFLKISARVRRILAAGSFKKRVFSAKHALFIVFGVLLMKAVLKLPSTG